MRDQEGFSFIDLLISLSILALVFAATQSQFFQMKRQIKSSEISLEARNLLDQILSELRNSEGFLPHVVHGNANLSFVRCFHPLTNPKPNAIDGSTQYLAVVLPRNSGAENHYATLRTPATINGVRACPDENGFESHVTFHDNDPDQALVQVITLHPQSTEEGAPTSGVRNTLEVRIRIPKTL